MIPSNLAQSHSTGSVAMGLLCCPSRGCRLPGGLCGKLLPWSFPHFLHHCACGVCYVYMCASCVHLVGSGLYSLLEPRRFAGTTPATLDPDPVISWHQTAVSVEGRSTKCEHSPQSPLAKVATYSGSLQPCCTRYQQRPCWYAAHCPQCAMRGALPSPLESASSSA